MIQVEEVLIEHVRGIRKLTLTMNRKSFAIHGPNGSGKSGVVDAIEFGLTGDITRLAGRGTGGLSVKAHGPHVDARDYPDKAAVTLQVYLTRLGKSVTLTRKLKSPKRFSLNPETPEAREELENIAQHPEVTLTRRQIAKFIIAEAGSRAKDVQALLRLEAIDQTRAALKSAASKTKTNEESARTAVAIAEGAVMRHLDVAELNESDILASINQRRSLVGAAPLTEWTATTTFRQGLGEDGQSGAAIDKASSTKDVAGLRTQLADDAGEAPAAELVSYANKLSENPELLVALQRRSFVEQGLGFSEEDACPLCDREWSLEELKDHLKGKLARAGQAEELQAGKSKAVSTFEASVLGMKKSLADASRVARLLKDTETESGLDDWSDELTKLFAALATVEGVMTNTDRLRSGWKNATEQRMALVTTLEGAVAAQTDSSEREAASTFLTRGDERLGALRSSARELERKQATNAAAHACHKAYSAASVQVLETLYQDVQREFAKSYRAINSNDEGDFSASFHPDDNKLELAVDFHGRGEFPPGAYHSEGHQDGMGLCLYLALMRQLFGKEFRLAVLDDVVMSVDKQHRKELCAMLATRYPDTQFIMTTHEQAWFHQMQKAGLVAPGAAVTFRRWSLETGPKTAVAQDTWEEIQEALEDDNVRGASASLRHYLEFVAGELADALVAGVGYRLDADHSLGDLLPSATSRFKKLLEDGVKAARKWEDADAEMAIGKRLETFKDAVARSNADNWMVNKSVHYNAWAEFSKEEFSPVVDAYRELLECMRCERCKEWIGAVPRGPGADTLRCRCSRVSINLAKK